MCCEPREMSKFGRLPPGDRFEEPLANLLNEQHRTVKEQLEQLKMKKSSGRQQQEVERVKPQPEKVHQTLTLDPAQRGRLQQQMQQVRPLRGRQAQPTSCPKVRNWCLDAR